VSAADPRDLRFRWPDRFEPVVPVAVSGPCTVVIFTSVRQNDPATDPGSLVLEQDLEGVS